MSGKPARDAIPLESTITASIQRWLNKQPCWWGYKVAGGAAQMRGVPDIVGCWRGRFVGFEVKRPTVGRVSDLQRHRIDQVRAAGGVAEVVYGLEDVRRVLDEVDSAIRAEGLAACSCDGGGD